MKITKLLAVSAFLVPVVAVGRDKITDIRRDTVYPEGGFPITSISWAVPSDSDRNLETRMTQLGALIERESSKGTEYAVSNAEKTITAFNVRGATKTSRVSVIAVTPLNTVVIFRDLAPVLEDLLKEKASAINLSDLEVGSITGDKISLTAGAEGVPNKVDMDIDVSLSRDGSLRLERVSPASR